MKPLAIQGVGAMTPLGEDARATLAALYSDVRLLRDLPVKRPDGQPVIGATTPVGLELTGSKRLFELGSYAFHDATQTLGGGAEVGLALCTPSIEDEGDLATELPSFCSRLASETGLKILPGATRIFPSGRDAIFEALPFAQTALRTQAAPAMCLLGIDSLVARTRLRRLVRNGVTAKEGFIPGEAGAAVLLTERPDADSLTIISGLGTADEPSIAAVPAVPNLGKGFGAAIEGAALDARLPKVAIAGLVHDLPTSPAAGEELAWAKGCSVLSVPSEIRVLAPAFSVGEAGAAMGILALLVLAFLIDKGVVDGPGLCLFSGESARRGTAVLLPSPYRKPSRS